MAEAALETTEFRASAPGRKLIKEKSFSPVNQSLPYPAPYQAYGSEAYPAPYRQAPERVITTYAQPQAVPVYPAYGYAQMSPAAVPVYPGEYGSTQAVPIYPGEFGSIYTGSTQAEPVMYPIPDALYLPFETPENDKQVQAARERRRQAFEAMKQAAEKEAQYRRAVRPMSILNEE